jgi:hypothetical protein
VLPLGIMREFGLGRPRVPRRDSGVNIGYLNSFTAPVDDRHHVRAGFIARATGLRVLVLGRHEP